MQAVGDVITYGFVMEDADDGRATGFGFANQLDYGGAVLASSEAVGSSSSRMGKSTIKPGGR